MVANSGLLVKLRIMDGCGVHTCVSGTLQLSKDMTTHERCFCAKFHHEIMDNFKTSIAGDQFAIFAQNALKKTCQSVPTPSDVIHIAFVEIFPIKSSLKKCRPAKLTTDDWSVC